MCICIWLFKIALFENANPHGFLKILRNTVSTENVLFVCVLVGCLGFMAYQPLKVIQCQIHFMQIVLFQTIPFSIIIQFVKTFLFQAIQFIQTVLIQLIQFSISTNFVYTQFNISIYSYSV